MSYFCGMYLATLKVELAYLSRSDRGDLLKLCALENEILIQMLHK